MFAQQAFERLAGQWVLRTCKRIVSPIPWPKPGGRGWSEAKPREVIPLQALRSGTFVWKSLWAAVLAIGLFAPGRIVQAVAADQPATESPTTEPAEAAPADGSSSGLPPDGESSSDSAPADESAAGDSPAVESSPAASAGGDTRANEPEPAAAELSAWVRQLGDPSYLVRRQAAERLARAGLSASQTLQAGLNDPDPEIRRQCRWILADVLEADFQRRVEVFLADHQGTGNHDLPGWQRFRRIAGHNTAARELFRQMLAAEKGLLLSAEASPQAAAESLELRLREVMSRMSSGPAKQRVRPSAATVAALLFVGSDPRLELPDTPAWYSWTMSVVQQPEFRKVLQEEGPLQQPARRLLGQWVLCPVPINLLYSKVSLAVQYGVPEGRVQALRLVERGESVPPHYRAFAVTALAKLGGKPDAGAIAGLLDDDGQVYRGTRAFRNAEGETVKKETVTQVRDVALAWLVHLTGQDHAAYGMDDAGNEFEQVVKSPTRNPNYSRLGFSDPAERERALKKWRQYVAEHPLPPPPDPADFDNDAAAAGAPAHGAAGGKAARPAPQAAPPGQQAAPPAKVRAAAAPAAVPAVGLAAKQPGPAAAQSEKPSPSGLRLQPAEREQVQNLRRAESLVELGQYAEATRVLDELLAAPTDTFFLPERSQARWRSVKDTAARLIAALPEEGRAAYRLRVETLARQMLDEAVRSGRMEAVRAVADRFFHTPPGAEAVLLLARERLEQGQPFHAALYLERLKRESADAAQFEPTLSLLLAVCWYRAGMVTRAEAAAAGLPDDVQDVYVAGRLQPAFPGAEPARLWLESLLGPPPAGSVGPQWPMHCGAPARNAWVSAAGAYLAGPALAPLSSDRGLQNAQAALEKQLRDEFRLGLPGLHPLVVDGCAVFRTATSLAAVEIESGRLVWEALLEDPLQHLLRDAGKKKLPWQSPEFRQALHQRLFKNLTFGTLSTDGARVFVVEDLPLGLPQETQRIMVTRHGRPRLAPGGLKRYNLLAAYDLATGKLVWELDGSPETSHPAAAEAWFLGPPLPLGRRLYVLAKVEAQTHLFEVEAATGRVISSLALTLGETPLEQPASLSARNVAALQPDESLLAGHSPSFADGLLVCRTLDDHLVALDLAAKKVLWVDRLPSTEQSMRSRVVKLLRARLGQLQQPDPDSQQQWIDQSLVIAQRRLLVPAPETDELVCLELGNGQQRWAVPCDDGLYVAGVWDGRVVVVGRGSVWALSLEDGSFAWPHQRVTLPEGALPSGRGLLAPPGFYLPLSTAEVAAIDLVEGRLVARSRSPGHLVPGNLVACSRAVLSQSAAGLWKFESLDARARRLGAAWDTAPGSNQPEDQQALLQRGELLLCQGKVAAAVDLLVKAAEGKPDSPAGRLLLTAITDGLELDFERFAPQAESWEELLESKAQRAELLRRLADGFRRTGRHQEAFTAYLKLIDVAQDAPALRHVEAARRVRTDCRLAARLEQLYEAADPAERAELDEMIRRRLEDRPLEEQAAREALALFSWHALAGQTRLKLAELCVRRAQALEAEQLLREVLRSGAPAEQRFAAAGLAELLASAGKHQAAARYYRWLAEEYPNTEVAGGRTGRELVDALAADDPVRLALDGTSEWPTGKVETHVDPKRASIAYRPPLTVEGADGRFDPRETIELDTQHRKLLGRDGWAQQPWEIALPGDASQWSAALSRYRYGAAWRRGHLLLLRMGSQLCAFDLLQSPARLLWVHETAAQSRTAGVVVFGPFGPFGAGGSWSERALPMVIGPQAVYLLSDWKLTALDTLSGEVRWVRDDLEPGACLFGDQQVLLVVPEEGGEALVFRAQDGQLLGRCALPRGRERLALAGRCVLTWQDGVQEARLALVDPWARETVWEHRFAPGAQAALVDQQRAAVFERSGRLVVMDIESGRLLAQSQLEAEPELESLGVLAWSQGYVVLVNRPGRQGNSLIGYPYIRQLPVHGRVYALGEQGGEPLWSRTIEDHALWVDQPAELPLLVLCSRIQHREGNRVVQRMRLTCLDKRDGRVLCDLDESRSASHIYQVQADLENKQVRVATYLGTITLRYTDQPQPAGEPPA